MPVESTISATAYSPTSLYWNLTSTPNPTVSGLGSFPPPAASSAGTPVAIAVPLVPLIIIGVLAFLLVQRLRKRRNTSNDVVTQTKTPSSISSIELQLAKKSKPAGRSYNMGPNLHYSHLDRFRSVHLEGGDIQKGLGDQYLVVSPERPSSQCYSQPEPNTRAFVRSAPARRSNSLGSLPLRPAAKNLTMKSQDSGFSSDMSLALSPGSPVSATNVLDSFTDHSAHSQAAMKRFIQDAVEKFLSKPDRIVGVCYASRIFAIGTFDQSGGTLKLANCEDAKLFIPPGALTSPTHVYFMVQFENNNNNDHTVNYSPAFECGPDGLQFEVPVLLTIPHTAVDTDVVALTRECDSGWAEDGSVDGAAIAEADVGTVTLSIKHFTGYKLSGCHGNTTANLNRTCRSRIPVRVQGSGGQRHSTAQQPGKRLSVSVFKKGDKARIYFISNHRSQIHRFVDESERSLQFTRDTHWKDLMYVCGKGGLVIETMATKNQRKSLYKRFVFNEDQVLSKNYEYVEVISSEPTLIIDVHFYQQSSADNVTQFSIKLEKLQSPANSLTPIERTHLKTVETWMNEPLMEQPLDRMSSMQCLPSSGRFPRSISEVSKMQHSPTRRPQEHCDHTNGACNCWREEPLRQPEESECDPSACQPANGMRRGVNYRRSKESGYESSVHSPVSPLKGPDSLSGNDSMAPGSSPSDLTLNTVGSESYQSQHASNYIQHTHL